MNLIRTVRQRHQRFAARLSEFGVTNGHRATHLSLPPIFMNSLPKSGTNLLSRFLYLTGVFRRAISPTVGGDLPLNRLRRLRKNAFLIAHAPYSSTLHTHLTDANVTNILMVRNPISVAVSNMHYIGSKISKHRLHDYFVNVLRSDPERLSAVLNGVQKERFGGATDSLPLVAHYRQYAGWASANNCLIIRFEDLVGPAGGGDLEDQNRTVDKLLQHIGLGADFNFPANELFSSHSRTFRDGKIFGASQSEVETFKASIDSEWVKILDVLGYGERFWQIHSPEILSKF